MQIRAESGGVPAGRERARQGYDGAVECARTHDPLATVSLRTASPLAEMLG